MAFATPAASSGFTFEDHAGALLIVEPLSVEGDIQTTFGPKDAVRANITVVDGEHAGDVHNDTLIFPRVLIGQLRSNIGEQVLGRLGQGNAKPGQKPPWRLDDPTPADLAAAEKYVESVEEPF
jgi:hypothetical protein